MEIQETSLRDVCLIKPVINTDFRGEYVMTFNEEEFGDHFRRPPLALNIMTGRKPLEAILPKSPVVFVEEDISTSFKGVMRGIHYSPNCWKLNQCLYGSIYYVVVNCDEEDPEFGKWEAFILSDRNRHQLFKHPRYGSGFLTLSDTSLFHYKQTEYYDSNNPSQQTFKWDDPRFKIWWPKLNNPPILSRRDEQGSYVPKE